MRRAWPGRQTLLSLFHVTFQILIGKLRFRKTSRPSSDPGMPRPAAPAPAREIHRLRAGGEERSEGRGSAPGSGARVRPPALRSERSALAAGTGGREGATDSWAWRSSPFFAADPGKGGRLGGGTAKGGIPPSCERRTGSSPGRELRPNGGATESTSTERRAGRGPRSRALGRARAGSSRPRGSMCRVGRWPRRA